MPQDPTRVQALFLQAVALAADNRTAFLDRECDGDPALRGRVAALLRAHDAPGSFLGPPSDGTGAFRPEPATAPDAGAVGALFAGRYKLREKLGEGGMGVVYVADQKEPVQRRVALKVIRADVPSARLLARFEQERQALALMDHPNIAKVFDAGVAPACFLLRRTDTTGTNRGRRRAPSCPPACGCESTSGAAPCRCRRPASGRA